MGAGEAGHRRGTHDGTPPLGRPGLSHGKVEVGSLARPSRPEDRGRVALIASKRVRVIPYRWCRLEISWSTKRRPPVAQRGDSAPSELGQSEDGVPFRYSGRPAMTATLRPRYKSGQKCIERVSSHGDFEGWREVPMDSVFKLNLAASTSECAAKRHDNCKPLTGDTLRWRVLETMLVSKIHRGEYRSGS